MRLLVVGANGFVGDYLTKYFRNINVEVVTCARRNADYCVDFSQKIDYKEYFGEDCFDVVVDCMNSYSTNMLQSIDGNVKTTENFFQCFKESSAHLIFISSISALSHNALANIYNLTKSLSERIIEYYIKNENLNVTVLRFSQLFDSKGLACKSQRGLYYFVDMIHQNMPINIFAKNEKNRNFFPVEEIGKIIKYAYINEIYGFHNIISPVMLKNSELALVLAQNTCYDLSLINKDFNKEAFGYFIPDCSEEFKKVTSEVNVLERLVNLTK